jgi:hypothetical protein
MDKDNIITTIQWVDDDLKEALENRGFKPTGENIDILLTNGLRKVLCDRSIEFGWDIIDTVIDDCENELE